MLNSTALFRRMRRPKVGRMQIGLRERLLALVIFAVAPGVVLVVSLGVGQRARAIQDARAECVRHLEVAIGTQREAVIGARHVLATLARLPELDDAGQRDRLNVLLGELVGDSKHLLNLGVTNARGDVIASGIPHSGPMNLEDRAWFRRALHTRRFAIGDYQVGRITSEPSVNVAWPMLDADGQVTAILYAALSLDWIQELSTALSLPDGSALVLIDPVGAVLARYPPEPQAVGHPGTVVRAMLSTREGTFEATGLDGEPRLYACAPLMPGLPGSGTLAIGILKSAVVRPASQALRRALQQLGLALFVAFAVAWWVASRLLVGPVRGLVSMTQDIAKGNLTARTGRIPGSGEVGMLADAVNAMAESLEKRELEVTSALEAARVSEDRFQRFMDNTPAVAFMQDPSGEYAYVNRMFEEAFGASRLAFDHSFHPFPSLAAMGCGSTADGESVADVCTTRSPADGSERHWLVYRFPVPTLDAGRSCGYVAVDVTALKHAEAAIRQAKDAVEATSRLKTEFLATVTHELRTPLQGVIGLADVMLFSELDAELRDAAQTIKQSAANLARVVDDILDFSRLEAQSLTVQYEYFDLAAAIGDTVTPAAARARAKGIEVTVTLPPVLPTPLRGDVTRLRQVLTKLIDNAVKFTESGEIHVLCNVEPAANQNVVLRVAVRDTGIGIQPDHVETIFESFRQADGSLTRRFGGVGLGLAIARHLVTLMQGRLGVHSEPGHGSTFWFEVPLQTPAAATMATPEYEHEHDLIRV